MCTSAKYQVTSLAIVRAQNWQGPREIEELLVQKLKGLNENDALLQLKSQGQSENEKLVAQNLNNQRK